VTGEKRREDFLEAIFVLKLRPGCVRSVDVARQLGIAKSSVSRTLKALVQEGYVEAPTSDSSALSLTNAGMQLARQTYERHCFFRDWLLWAGVDPETAEAEACLLEHAISQKSFGLIRSALGEGKATAI